MSTGEHEITRTDLYIRGNEDTIMAMDLAVYKCLSEHHLPPTHRDVRYQVPKRYGQGKVRHSLGNIWIEEKDNHSVILAAGIRQVNGSHFDGIHSHPVAFGNLLYAIKVEDGQNFGVFVTCSGEVTYSKSNKGERNLPEQSGMEEVLLQLEYVREEDFNQSGFSREISQEEVGNLVSSLVALYQVDARRPKIDLGLQFYEMD